MYGKSWSSEEEITDADKVAFVEWINTGMALQGGGGSKPRKGLSELMPRMPRSSSRVDAMLRTPVVVPTVTANLVVEQGVL